MNEESRPTAEELFAGAVALAGEQRSRFLDSWCGRDDPLRSEVEDLLRFHDAAGEFLEVPPLTMASRVALPEAMDEAAGMPGRIGHFRLERELGVGGMGRVYLAESEQPRRWVALKVVRTGAGGESLRRRFEQEAQVIALLQHPGIAQLYEAGTTDSPDGTQPYFAMEYVDGPTLTEYARRGGLTMRGKLELMCRVCDAVEHAHRRGVVHRDLKPGNILVDSSGQPKILDFGVARLIDPETAGSNGSATLHTHAGQLIGTLSYMSPEQVEGTPGAVDGRSDVYALGVIMFELLTGRLPHDVSRCSIPEAIRTIREDLPASLSTIDRGYRGDIETIVGKALEKEPARRYQSAAELAADIRRSLRDEPIVARPPGTWYQLTKFAKRNKTLVGGTVATIVALSTGLVAAVWQAREANAARIDAEARETEAKEARLDALAAQKTAEENLETSQEINSFMQRVFASPNPNERMGRDVTVMEVMDRAAPHLEETLSEKPHVRAAMHRIIGNTYRTLTEYARAEPHIREACEIYTALYGERHEETHQAMEALVLLLSEQGKHDAALELGVRQWEIAQEILDEDDPRRMEAASNLAAAMLDVGRWREAEELQRLVLRERARLLPAGDDSVLAAKHRLGRTLARMGRMQEALTLQREGVEASRRDGEPMSTALFTAILGLANTLLDAGQYDEAQALAEELEQEGRDLFDEDHNAMLSVRNVKGQVLMRGGRHAEAEAVFRELVEAHARSEIPATDGLVRVMSNLGGALQHQGKLEESEATYRRAVAILDESRTPPDRVRIALLNNLATVLRLKGDYASSLPVYEELVRVAEDMLPPGDFTTAAAKYGYGVVLLQARRPEEAEAQFKGAYDLLTASFPESDERVVTVMRSFVNLYSLWKKPEKAEFWRQKLPAKYREEK